MVILREDLRNQWQRGLIRNIKQDHCGRRSGSLFLTAGMKAPGLTG